MSTDDIIVFLKCAGCHTTKVIGNFGINNKGVYYKTCDNCRLRNKTKRIKQVKDESNKTKGNLHVDTKLEEDAMHETLTLSNKSYNLFLNKFQIIRTCYVLQLK